VIFETVAQLNYVGAPIWLLFALNSLSYARGQTDHRVIVHAIHDVIVACCQNANGLGYAAVTLSVHLLSNFTIGFVIAEVDHYCVVG
jgi:hypothetical protein